MNRAKMDPLVPRLLFVPAGLALLAALWAGLLRLGWNLPPLTQSLPPNHGPLMIVGFLGTLISLERAVAIQRIWPYGAPVFAGFAALGLLTGLPQDWTGILAATGSLFLTAIFFLLYTTSPAAHWVTIGLGSFVWFGGNLLWLLGFPTRQIVPWWIGFLVLTIAGERLELARIIQPSWSSRVMFHLSTGVFLLGLGVLLFAFVAGIRLGGVGLTAMALWLLRYDIVWQSVQQIGLPRFMALSLLAGYIWLGVGGLLWIFSSQLLGAGVYYDAMLHSIFLGFVFSMIFAHAPIIFPSVVGLAMPFQKSFYGHLVLLHLSLLLRVGGDLAMWTPGQMWGGLLNVLAILLFLANNVRAVRLGRFVAVGATSDSVAIKDRR